VTTVMWGIAALLGMLDLYAVRRVDLRLESVAKPLAVMAILVAGIASGLLGRGWGIVVVLGLVFGLVGDVLLLGDGDTRFVGGLASFLGGHLLYLGAFLLVGLRLTPWLVAATVLTVVCVALSRGVLPAAWRDGRAAMAAPVAAYMVVLGLTALAAAGTGRPLVALGGMLFLVSDTVLAVDRFVRQRAGAHLVVMATYLLAQTGIVAGMALR